MQENYKNRLAISKRILFCLFISSVLPCNLFAQQDKIDSLNYILTRNTATDSVRINTLNKLATLSGRNDKQLAYSLFSQSISLARSSKNVYGEVRALIGLTKFQREDGNFTKSRESLLEALELTKKNYAPNLVAHALNDFYQDYFVYPGGDKIKELEYAVNYLKSAEQYNIPPVIADACTQTGIVFALLGDFSNGLKYHLRALKILEQNQYRNSLIHAHALLFLGETFNSEGYDVQAIEKYKQSFQLANTFNAVVFKIENESNIAGVYLKQKRYDETFAIAFRTLSAYTYLKVDGGISYVSLILARAYLNTNKPDSALVFAKASVQFAEKADDLDLLRGGHGVLSKVYAIKKDFKTAHFHNLLYKRFDDSLFDKSKTHQVAYLQYSAEMALKESKISLLEKDKEIQVSERRRQKMILYGMVVGTTLVLVVMLILVKSYRSKQRANALLEKQKQEIQSTLTELKATQSQLVQREKMASLGELTAGIAHEIQNPLNFVNNFSEVNAELIGELKTELRSGNKEEAISIAHSIEENEQKINHHGKRADAIIKGMLQHSRNTSSQKQPTDINALADEYLRLSYHGFRAKDKSFNVTLQTDFDKSLGETVIVRQDIGIVLLNLFNNAFYYITEKMKEATEYKAVISVSTKRIENKPDGHWVEIKVKDNGNGIPKKVLDKIFQPFFTTKPSGQGTGLGLSLSYDIIKAHGGEIKVETREGEFAEFIVHLPDA